MINTNTYWIFLCVLSTKGKLTTILQCSFSYLACGSLDRLLPSGAGSLRWRSTLTSTMCSRPRKPSNRTKTKEDWKSHSLTSSFSLKYVWRFSLRSWNTCLKKFKVSMTTCSFVWLSSTSLFRRSAGLRQSEAWNTKPLLSLSLPGWKYRTSHNFTKTNSNLHNYQVIFFRSMI